MYFIVTKAFFISLFFVILHVFILLWFIFESKDEKLDISICFFAWMSSLIAWVILTIYLLAPILFRGMRGIL